MDSVAFSPDGKLAVSTGWDKMVKIWDVATGKLLVSSLRHILSGSTMRSPIILAASGSRLPARTNLIRVWDVESILRSVTPAEKK